MHKEAKIIHRDIKLENILIDFDYQGNVKTHLTDFGFSQEIEQLHRENKYYIVGTPNYFAIEMLTRGMIIPNKYYYDERIDIWCLGVAMFILLFGHAPFSSAIYNKYGVMVEPQIRGGSP